MIDDQLVVVVYEELPEIKEFDYAYVLSRIAGQDRSTSAPQGVLDND